MVLPCLGAGVAISMCMKKPIRDQTFAVLLSLLLGAMPLVASAQGDVAGSQKAPAPAGSGDTFEVIDRKGKTVSPETGGGQGDQSSQRFIISGESQPAGVSSMSTELVLEIACRSPGKDSLICKEKSKSIKAFEATAKELGIPSVALICVEAAMEKGIDDKAPPSDPKQKADAEAEKKKKEMEKLEKAKYEAKSSAWEKATGLKKDDALFYPTFTKVSEFRKMLRPIEKEIAKDARHGGRKGFLDLVKFYAISLKFSDQGEGDQQAKDYYMALRKGSDPGIYPNFMKAVLECVDAAFTHEKVKAPALSSAKDE